VLLIGCDPEFTMIDKKGKPVCSNPYLEKLIPHFRRKIGRDRGGGGYIWELRPNPSTNPREVVEEIRYLFSQIAIHCPETLQYTWLAGSSVKGLPLGGHIHFGVFLEKEMIMALDVLLAPVVALINDQEKLKGYGQLGDWRKKAHGFEYRSLGSWLWAPGITLGILALAQVIVWDSLKRRLPLKKIAKLECSGYILNDKISISEARNFFPQIWETIASLRSVKRFWPEISFLKELVLRQRTWENGQDIKARWRISSTNKPA